MANNPYVNKVQLANGTTLIDISDTTAVASDVASGKYFYNAAGAKVQGTATIGGISITEYEDSNGGTVLDINGPVTSIEAVQTYYTGSSAPPSSLGSNGDLYLEVTS